MSAMQTLMPGTYFKFSLYLSSPRSMSKMFGEEFWSGFRIIVSSGFFFIRNFNFFTINGVVKMLCSKHDR